MPYLLCYNLSIGPVVSDDVITRHDLSKLKFLTGESLAWEFAETASMYARIIISELFLHPSKRTFPSVDIGEISSFSVMIS